MPVDAEIMTQSPSQTVSIYEALAEILSKPTESLTLSNSKSTDRTLFSEAPISSTTTSTTTTTTSTTPVPTTEANDDFKVENSTLEGLETVQTVNTARVNNQQSSTEASTTEYVFQLTTNYDDLTTTTLSYTETPSPSQTSPPLTTTENDMKETLNHSQTVPTTTEDEFSTFHTTQTYLELRPNTAATETILTNNLTNFDNKTNAINKTEIEETETNLKLDQSRSTLKQAKIYSPNNIIRNNFMKALTTSNVPINYVPRFSQANRIPILSFGDFRNDRKIESTTKSIKIDLMTRRIAKKGDERFLYSTPSVYPIYRPEFETTTVKSTFSSTETSSHATKLITEPSMESSKVTEMIVTSSVVTLTDKETTTFNADDLIDSEMSTQMPDETESKTASASTIVSHTVLSTGASTAAVFTTLSNIFINEINELTTTDRPATTTDNRKTIADPIFTQPTTVSSITETQSTFETPSPPLINKPSPFKTPKTLFPQPPPKPQRKDASRVQERVVYAILPNNTVIKKTIQERLTTENPYVIYGIFPNKTVVRKFRNGTILPDERETRIEITNIDPKSLTNPNSEFHKKASETTLENSVIASATNLPITDHTKTVFYLLIFYLLAERKLAQSKQKLVLVKSLDFIGLRLLLAYSQKCLLHLPPTNPNQNY